MKDKKNVMLAILMVVCIVLAYLAFTKDGGEYKQQLKDLAQKNAEIEKQRKTIDSTLSVLKLQYDSLKQQEAVLVATIENQDAEIEKRKKIAAQSQAELDSIKKELANTREAIKKAKANPPNRTGDDLLNSLKIKTRQ